MKSQMRDSNNWFLELKQPPAAARRLELAEGPRGGRTPQRTGEVAILETDESGFISSWSNKAVQVYGYEFDEIVGKHLASLYTIGDLLHGKLIHELQAAESRAVYFTFGWQKRNNGQEFWAYSEYQAIKDAAGKLLGYRKFVVETSTSMQT